MKDSYVNAFREVVVATTQENGFDIPESVECYIVMLLANFMEQPNFLQDEGVGRALFMLEHPKQKSAKELGDACLFVSGVFPHYGRRYGISRKYYIDVGATSYDIVSNYLHPELFGILSKNFEFVSTIIETSTNKDAQYKNIWL